MSIELAWTLVSLAGLLAAVWGVFDAWGDLRALEGVANGRRIIARGYLRAELIRVAIQAILLGLGIGPLLDPAPVRSSVFVLALMAVNVLLLANSVLAGIDRLRIRRTLYSESAAT